MGSSQEVARLNTRTLQVALRCLLHPVAIGSISLLVLNDHLLKEAAPSWLTGKLSDFAGLFFFPFLLAVVIGIFAIAAGRGGSQAPGKVAFGITALWFAAAKATPLGNSLTAQAVAVLLGHPVSIALDPTDLTALTVLWPAWLLWLREASTEHAQRAPAWFGWVALMAASLASMGTQPIPQELAFHFVVTDNHELYVLTKYDQIYSLPKSRVSRLYRTLDHGMTWQRLEPIPEGFRVEIQEVWGEESTVVDPSFAGLYRVKAEGRVEYSGDSGITWRTIWEVPDDRQELLNRSYGGWLEPMIGPYDLVFSPDGSGILLVALGTEGILIRDASGAWSRHSVGEAKPSTICGFNPVQALGLLVFPEGLLIVAAMLLALPVASAAGWMPLLTRVRRVSGMRRVWRVLLPQAICILAAAGTALAIGILFKPPDGRSFDEGLIVYSCLFLAGLLALGSLLTWSGVIAEAVDRSSLDRCAMACLWIAPGLLITAGLPFYLWVGGIVRWHSTAVFIAFVFGFVTVAMESIFVYHLTRAAVGAFGSIKGEADAT